MKTLNGTLRSLAAAISIAIGLAIGLAAATTTARAQDDASVPGLDPHLDTTPELHVWKAGVIDAVSRIPLQADGRIKPLSTFADFKLLQFSGRRQLRWEVGNGGQVETKKRSSVEWLLDVLFFPEAAVRYPCFLLDTYEVADAIGVARGEKNKRDRWTYLELEPGRDALSRKHREIMKDPIRKEAKNRTVVEEQLVQLYEKMSEFEGLLYYLEFARFEYPVGEGGETRALVGGADKASFATLIDATPRIEEELRALRDPASGIDEARRTAETVALNTLLQNLKEATGFSSALALFPPPGMPGGNVSKEDPWLSVGDVVGGFLNGDRRLQPQLAQVSLLARAWESRENADALDATLVEWNRSVVDAARTRGEYRKIESEVAFYKADLFYYALIFYVLGFVGVASSWLTRTDSRLHVWLPRLLLLPLTLHVAGIVWRCILRGRPPVSTLYETILFISGIAVAAALVLEYLNRRRIAVVFAALLGSAGLFLAARYEVKEAFDSGADTMPQLQAVLNTNFWLSTHVTTVTIGYSAGLLAAFLAHVYVLGRLIGFRKNDVDLYRNVVRMVYGVLCFGLLFSVVGTILGGVWANDSWGRFWGWDPKENGALMICLCELAILHGRMGGYLRELGLCAAAVFNGVVVAFSWWHVNLLGVGLHAYGFTHGIVGRLWIFYGCEALVLFAALYLWLDRRAEKKLATSLSKPTPQPGT